MPLLDSINSPKDLKKLQIGELPQLADEVRSLIIDVVSKTGGHLAPSLGAVDFIIALHYCLDAPKDTIVWDVGHQSYCHKILTGRKDAFSNLRQKGGLSGFPNINESEYDPFTVGHGSTSISTALGLCLARDLKETDEKVVAVIGDGSLGGGMAFEGLNHAGQLRKDILIILNDNEFSISPSVGAFSRYLNRIATNPIYNRVREDVDRLIRRVPRLGFRLAGAARKLEEGLKNLLVPGILFDEMGIRYFGPIDGHNIGAVIEVINNVLPLNEPRLVHIVTQKGKGFKHAEKKPAKFHGITPFDTKKGKSTVDKAPSFTETFSNKMVELASGNKKIVAITAAMPEGTGLDKFENRFPERFFNVGMAEEHAIGFAAGLARKGLVPIVAIYSTFLQRSYDQIIHDVCLQNLHVVLCLDRAGIVGEDGPTHHGVFDISYLRHIPNLVCMAPKDLLELEDMLEFAVLHRSPISIRYPRGGPLGQETANTQTENSRERIELGKSEILRVGRDVAILAVGDMVLPALEASHILAKNNIETEVVNMRFIKPIDSDTILKLAERIKKILVVEDNVLEGGFGSAVIEVLSDNNIDVDIKRIGLPDEFITYSSREDLLGKFGLSAEKITERIEEWLR
ncbi:MAG: 1-deoxy-D-xylulose-5-phosphate synthase [Candidatus Omnitrophica bacterium]|nr:1-deoxy-D-xylulose-5-phosphate synthase [Candidatus Omnitrophota bacterium]